MESKSNKTKINVSSLQIIDFVGNFNNFGDLLPDQVEDWRATEHECFFKIKGLMELGLQIQEKIPASKVIIVNHPGVSLPLSFSLTIEANALSENESEVQALMDTQVNPMMGMMLKKPLHTFVETLVEKLKQKMEQV